MKYFVEMNLNRDLRDYVPGDTIDLAEDVAADLLEAGVLTTDEVAAPAPEVVEPEPTAQPEVGGTPTISGEPSLDGTAAQPAPTEAKDITPVVDDAPVAESEAPIVVDTPVSDVVAPAPVVEAPVEDDPSANL